MKNDILEGKHKSIWIDTFPGVQFDKLKEDLEVELAVVGGGMAGIMTAYYLAKAGVGVALFERDRLAESVTGHTTAKLTSNHGADYQVIVEKYGEDKARLYAEANQQSIEEVARLVEELSIDCDFYRYPSITYGVDGKQKDILIKETEIAKKLGLSVEFRKELPLPYFHTGGIVYQNQALFHPRKFLFRIVEEISKLGGRIYENTVVSKIENEPAQFMANDHLVKAKKIMICTDFPIKDPDLYYAKLTTRQSYVIVYKSDWQPDGMYYSIEDNFHSFRPMPIGDQKFIQFGSEVHEVGHGGDVIERYNRMNEWVQDNFKVGPVEYYWTTHDTETFDRVPMIGRLTKDTNNLFVATGFKGWGMTHSIVAGKILSDIYIGKENKWSELYNPERVQTYFSAAMIKYNFENITNLIKGKITGAEKEKVDSISPGEAKVIEDRKGEKIGVYKDEGRKVMAVSPFCTHMGCQVNWNNAEKSWDCPCHGSRFTHEGKVIHDPAIEDLNREEIK